MASKLPVPTKTLTFVGGFTLFHQWEFFRSSSTHWPYYTNIVYYVTPHFSQFSHPRFGEFEWGQTLADWPKDSQPRMEAILTKMGVDLDGYIPFEAVKIWCDQVLRDMVAYSREHRTIFDLHICKDVSVTGRITEKHIVHTTGDAEKDITATIWYTEEVMERTRNEESKEQAREVIREVTREVTLTLSKHNQLITGIKSLRQPIFFPQFLNFRTYAPDFFARDPLPTGSPLNDLPTLCVGSGPSAMWITQILTLLKKKCRIMGLNVSKLPTNPRNKKMVEIIKKNPHEFQLPLGLNIFRTGDLGKPTSSIPPEVAREISSELTRRGLNTVEGHDDLAAVFIFDFHQMKYVLDNFYKVVLCTGFNDVLVFPEGTDFYHSFNPSQDALKEDILPIDARGSVLHPLSSLHYIMKSRLKVSDISDEGSNFNPMSFNPIIARPMQWDIMSRAHEIGVRDINPGFFRNVQEEMDRLTVRQRRQLTIERTQALYETAYQRNIFRLGVPTYQARLPDFQKLFGFGRKLVFKRSPLPEEDY
jgi:hypothetical protein